MLNKYRTIDDFGILGHYMICTKCLKATRVGALTYETHDGSLFVCTTCAPVEKKEKTFKCNMPGCENTYTSHYYNTRYCPDCKSKFKTPSVELRARQIALGIIHNSKEQRKDLNDIIDQITELIDWASDIKEMADSLLTHTKKIKEIFNENLNSTI